MEVQIYCCSTVDYVAAGEWIFIEGATEEVEVTFVDQQGGKKTVDMFIGDKVALPFVGLHLRSKGDDQVIKLRAGWGDFTPSIAAGLVAGMSSLDGGSSHTCVDVASPIQNIETQTYDVINKDIIVPANGSEFLNLYEEFLNTPQSRISKMLIQNASVTTTRCRVNMLSGNGIWVVGGGDSIGQVDWFDVGSVGSAWVKNLSNEEALITVTVLVYWDDGNPCRVNFVDE